MSFSKGNRMRAIFYDTETTGLRAGKDRIIEIAAYDPTLNKTFESFVNPQIPIPPESSQIHNITDEMVRDAPYFDQVAKDFIEFCDGDVILVAHNNDSFDFPFMAAEFERVGVPMPKWKSLCSLKWARRYRPDLPTHKLQTLRELFGIPSNQAHRALDDVKVLTEVFHHLIDDLPIQEVFDLLNKPRQIQHMPFGKYQGKPLKELPADYIAWMKGSGAFEKPDNLELKNTLVQLGLLN